MSLFAVARIANFLLAFLAILDRSEFVRRVLPSTLRMWSIINCSSQTHTHTSVYTGTTLTAVTLIT